MIFAFCEGRDDGSFSHEEGSFLRCYVNEVKAMGHYFFLYVSP